MSNVAGKAYGMNVLTPMRPRRTWLNTLIFMVSRALPGELAGLLGLSLIHFARWVIIRRDQWPERGQGQQPLAERLHAVLQQLQRHLGPVYRRLRRRHSRAGSTCSGIRAPNIRNSIPITPFKNYIRANQIDTDYYYNATPGSAQRDIKPALELAAASAARSIADRGDDELAAAYRAILLNGQDGLGSPGYAPVASCDTAVADLHRCAEVAALGAEGRGRAAAEHASIRSRPRRCEASPRSGDRPRSRRSAPRSHRGRQRPRTDEARRFRSRANGGDRCPTSTAAIISSPRSVPVCNARHRRA